MIHRSQVKISPHAARAQGGDMSFKRELHTKIHAALVRMVCRSEYL